MTLTLRALLIIVSVLATTGVIGRIRKAKMQIEDAVFWVLFSFLLILLAVVPRVLYFFTELLGMQSPANLLFLVIIGLLLMKVFSMSIKFSLLEEKLKTEGVEAAKDLCRNTRGPIASICYQGLLRIGSSMEEVERSVSS